jgi:two-component system, OmpR family, sensor kinase
MVARARLLGGQAASLRWRLGLAYALIAAVLLAVVLGLTNAIVEQALIEATAARLEIEAGLIASESDTGRGVTATDLAAGELAGVLGGQQTGVVVLDPAGATLASVSNGAADAVVAARLAPEAYARIVGGTESATAVVSTAAGDVLLVAVPLQIRLGDGPPIDRGRPDDKGPPPGRGLGNQGNATAGGTNTAETANAVAQLAVSLAPVHATLADLQRGLLAVGFVLLLAAILVALLVTRVSLRPLSRVAEVADRVSSGDLGARVGLPAGSDEIGRLGSAFDTMVERVEANLRAQRQFAADASHELRSPLTVLGGFVDVLGRGELGQTESGRRTLTAMRGEVDRLSRLATDLLLLSQIEAGGTSLAPRPMDLADLVEDVGEAARIIATDQTVLIERDGPLPVSADRDRLTQAVMNLVDNAVRHSPAGGTIRLTTHRVDADAVVTVANEGRAIDPRHLPHLFERFYRVRTDDDAEAQGRHAGLGLPIVKAIVEASGGGVGVTSDGRETTFEIRLPLVAA